MGVDEARHDDLAAAIEGFTGSVRAEKGIGRANGDNRIILNGNGSLDKYLKGLIHRHNGGADQEQINLCTHDLSSNWIINLPHPKSL
jgi:hypothetical protein